MHILIVTYNDYPAFEGLGTRIANIARVLTEHGCEVTVFAPNIDKQQPREEWADGVRIVRITLYVPAFLARVRVLARAWCMLGQSLLSVRAYRYFFRKMEIADHGSRFGFKDIDALDPIARKIRIDARKCLQH